MTPPPLPEPPQNYSDLVTFPALPKNALPRLLYRVHRVVREPEFFSAAGSYRWDPPAGPEPVFGTCYTATDPLTALAETLGDLPMITEEMLEARAIAVIEDVPDDLRIADMASSLILGQWGLDRRISVGDDYPVSQRWASALRHAGFDGVIYEARHNAGGYSLAIFGDPGYQPQQLAVASEHPIDESIQTDLIAYFGFQIFPSSSLGTPRSAD